MERTLKLNTKTTFYVGLAFFAILMLWQVYNTYCPLILEELLANKYSDSDRLTYVIGIIMAMDNLAALILMPIFGNLSDKTHTKIGKRMPYILIGMVASAIGFPLIAVFYLYNSLIGVIIMMGLILVIMQSYRSPAVALMPDITPKPLRSKANGIINLVGYIGAILAGALAMVFKVSSGTTGGKTYLWPFIISAVLMLVAMIILKFKIDEPKILEEVKDDIEYGETQSKSLSDIKEDKPLDRKDKINLIILLIAIFFWFMAFNSVETFNSLFAKKILDNSGIHGTFTIILTVSSILSFIFFSGVSSKIGRKMTVLIGLVMLVAGLGGMALFTLLCTAETVKKLVFIIYIFTAIIGIGWALVNINSYPMIVEMASQKNIGKFTGFYYTSSMIAQTATPILVGLIMSFNTNGLKILYVYAAVLMAISLFIFIFSKERKNNKNDNTKEKTKKSILENLGDADN